MNVYTDLTLLLSDDISQAFLWEKLYTQLHFALVDSQKSQATSPFGFAFPQYSLLSPIGMGRKLRVMASNEADLRRLDIENYLSRLLDYVHITSCQEVPEDVRKYACYRRVQVKSGAERLARRAAKRQGMPYETALTQRRSLERARTNLPYVWMSSTSSKSRFRLFVQEEVVSRESVDSLGEVSNKFSFYGLSSSVHRSFLPKF